MGGIQISSNDCKICVGLTRLPLWATPSQSDHLLSSSSTMRLEARSPCRTKRSPGPLLVSSVQIFLASFEQKIDHKVGHYYCFFSVFLSPCTTWISHGGTIYFSATRLWTATYTATLSLPNILIFSLGKHAFLCHRYHKNLVCHWCHSYHYQPKSKAICIG